MQKYCQLPVYHCITMLYSLGEDFAKAIWFNVANTTLFLIYIILCAMQIIMLWAIAICPFTSQRIVAILLVLLKFQLFFWQVEFTFIWFFEYWIKLLHNWGHYQEESQEFIELYSYVYLDMQWNMAHFSLYQVKFGLQQVVIIYFHSKLKEGRVLLRNKHDYSMTGVWLQSHHDMAAIGMHKWLQQVRVSDCTMYACFQLCLTISVVLSAS